MGFDDLEPGAALRQDEIARQGGCPGLPRRADEEQMNRLGGCFARRDGDKGAILKKGGVERREKVRVRMGVPGQVHFHFGGMARQLPQQITQLQIIAFFGQRAKVRAKMSIYKYEPVGVQSESKARDVLAGDLGTQVFGGVEGQLQHRGHVREFPLFLPRGGKTNLGRPRPRRAANGPQPGRKAVCIRLGK